MKKLIQAIIAFFKGLKKEVKQNIKEQLPPPEKSQAYKEIERFLRRRQLKALKNSGKRYASTKGF